jgi:hypothetical protein
MNPPVGGQAPNPPTAETMNNERQVMFAGSVLAEISLRTVWASSSEKVFTLGLWPLLYGRNFDRRKVTVLLGESGQTVGFHLAVICLPLVLP